MIELLAQYVGTGLVVALLFSEVFGITAGGLVVPGYLALYLDKPIVILATLLASYVTYLLVFAISQIVILYGRRRIVFMLLAGYVVGALFQQLFKDLIPPTNYEWMSPQVIGHIIPGLIALWFDRQGIAVTVATLSIVACLTRLTIIVLWGTNIG